ncbi:carboxymuconolactone decarboxylase family protein [Geminicoccaceae bacterium 1502E]|nr:carboxymuconolactone decarboxylase family protein [Geminicoccaceae bacterium 1502E]
MAFIDTVPEEQATGATQEMYAKARTAFGYIPNLTRVLSHRPEAMGAWDALLGAIRGNMDLRRHELVTLAAAKALRSSYCMLAHGSVLLPPLLRAGGAACHRRGSGRARSG